MHKLIVAHRGAPRMARENTLAAFQKAIELGADAIELDVRMTKDGRLAVIHDGNVGSENISNLSYAELNQVTSTANYSVPTLEEALNLIAGKALLQIEIKESGYEAKVAESALMFFDVKNFVIISFNLESLKKIKKNYPQIHTGLILGSNRHRLPQVFKFIFFQKSILTFIDELSINWKLWKWGLANLVPSASPITVWTADEPGLIKELLDDEKITYIASNVPDVALKLRNQYEPQ